MNHFGVLFSVFGIQESLYRYFIIWLVSIFIHGYFVLDFLSFGYQIFRIDLKNLDPFLMLENFSCMKDSNLIFSSLNFPWLIWIAWWISKSSTQRFCTYCCFWCYVHSLILTHCERIIQYILMWLCFTGFEIVMHMLQYTLSQSYSITWLLLGLIVKKLKLSFLDFRETLLIKIVQFISVQLDLVMSR